MNKQIIVIIYLLQSCTSNHTEKNQEITSDIKKQPIVKQVSVKGKLDENNDDFLATWTKFVHSVEKPDFSSLSNISMDSIKVGKKKIVFKEFVKSYYTKIFNPRIKLLIKDTNKITFSDFEIDVNSLPVRDMDKNRVISNILKQVVITTNDTNSSDSSTLVFEFAKTELGYKFWRCDEFGSVLFQ